MNIPFYKRSPSVDLGPYYVEIQDEAIDFDNPVIQGIVDNLGGLETWPQLTLQQFKDLTEQLRVKVALGTGEIVNIGDVNYLTVDPDTQKPQDTGLSWDGATVPPNMDNFVISTVEQVLNDEDIRVDEQISYTDIENALLQLISAAETLTDLDEGDMPALPDEETYTTALEQNQTLHVVPRKLTDGPSGQVVDAEPALASPVTEPLPESSVAERAANTVPTVPSAPTPVAPTMPKAPSAPTTPSVPSTTPASQSAEPEQPKSRVTGATNRADTLMDKIQQFEVNVPAFTVDEDLLASVVSPEDERYVDVMVARQKAEANKVLAHSADDLTAVTHRDLMNVASQATLNNEEIDRLLSDDWQAPLSKQIAQKQYQAFANRLAETKKNLTAAFDEDVAREKTRHESAMSDLKRQYEGDVDKVTAQNESDREHAIQTETTQAIAQQSLYIDKEVARLYQQAEAKATHQIIEAMITRQSEVEEALADSLDVMAEAIEVERQQFLSEHESALEKRHSADEATAKMTQAQNANHDLTQLTSNNTALEAERGALREKIVTLQAEAAKWQAQAEGTQSDLDRLAARLAEVTQGEQQTALIAALAGTRQPESAPAPKHSFLKGAVTSAALLLGLGGISYGTYHIMDMQAKNEASVKAAEASYNAKTVTLKKQLKEAQATSAASSSSTSVASSSTSVASTATSTSQNFEALDADVANGSLRTYYTNFDKANLATEERTLAVGKLLVEMHNFNDAKELAAANEGHNIQLLSLINSSEIAK